MTDRSIAFAEDIEENLETSKKTRVKTNRGSDNVAGTIQKGRWFLWIIGSTPWMLIALLFLPGSVFAGSTEFNANLNLNTFYTSNVFMDNSQQWDMALKPSAELALDFADYWSLGYNGQLNAYLQNESLLSHWHELHLFVNPAWGKENQNEFVLELSIETLRNQPAYQVLDLVAPTLLAKLILEPKSWIRYRLSANLSYRWFQHDKASNSVDAWVTGSLGFTLPTNTTLSPKVAYGMRLYPNQDTTVIANDRDDQIKLGLHASQALGKKAGLQLNYTYFWPFDKSGLLEYKLTQAQFTYLGEDFIFSGHVFSFGYKRIFSPNITAGVFFQYEQRTYPGWKAIDAAGILKEEDRSDQRLIPRAYLDFSWSSKKSKSEKSNWELGLSLDYRYIYQQSNSAWYDTQAHQALLSFFVSL